MMPQWCPVPLHSLPAHAVVYWYVLGPLEITFEKGRGVELYDAAVSGTAVPAPLPSRLSVRCRGVWHSRARSPY